MRKILFTIMMIIMFIAIAQAAPLWISLLVFFILAIGTVFFYFVSDSHDAQMRGNKRGEKY